MRKPIIAGNWKMYKTESEAVDFVKQLRPLVADVRDRSIILCAPAPCLSKMCDVVCNCCIALGAQNMFWENEGAYTGEISAPMLKAVGCTHVILGHSERRQYFGETDEMVNKKTLAALKNQMQPIVCVGETLEQRGKKQTFAVIEKQIKEGLKNIKIDNLPDGEAGFSSIIIAYEPVWAIGTDKTATPEQAQEVHAFIRGLLPKEVAEGIRILYGGSVKPENIRELMQQKDIDGGLVGGASLKVDSFVKLIKF